MLFESDYINVWLKAPAIHYYGAKSPAKFVPSWAHTHPSGPFKANVVIQQQLGFYPLIVNSIKYNDNKNKTMFLFFSGFNIFIISIK